MMRTSCVLWREWNGLKLLLRPSKFIHCFHFSFPHKCQVGFHFLLSLYERINPHGPGSLKDGYDQKYMKAACQCCMWSHKTERGAGTLNLALSVTFGFNLGAKQNRNTTILSFYFDLRDPPSLMEVKLEADTSGEAHLSDCVRRMALIASLGSLMTMAYLRAECLTNTATLRSRGSVHRAPRDESEWEIFQACELIRLHV